MLGSVCVLEFVCINVSPFAGIEKLVWWVRQRCDARLTLLRFQQVSSRIPLVALWSVVRREGFDRQRGESSGRSFRGSLRRYNRLPQTATFVCIPARSPRLPNQALHNTAT